MTGRGRSRNRGGRGRGRGASSSSSEPARSTSRGEGGGHEEEEEGHGVTDPAPDTPSMPPPPPPPPKAQQQSKSPGFPMPEPGTPQELRPVSQQSSKAPSPARSTSQSRSPSPIRLPEGLTTQSEDWLSMKHPDMLSASERVMHSNLANIAIRLDNLQKGLVYFASSRVTGKSGATPASQQAETEAATQDRQTLNKLDKEDFVGILRESLGTFKDKISGGFKTRAGGPATQQAAEYIEHLGEIAEAERVERDTSTAMETGEADTYMPRAEIYALATGLSESGRTQWFLKLLKDLGFVEKRSIGKPPKKSKKTGEDEGQEEVVAESSKAAGKKRKGRDSEEGAESGAEDEQARTGSPKKRGKKTIPISSDDEDDDDDDDQ